MERLSCSEKKPKRQSFQRIVRYNLHIKVPFLNGNLSFYSCFIDVLYDLRRILPLTFDFFGSFYLREMIHDPVSFTRIAFKDKIMGFRIKFFDE